MKRRAQAAERLHPLLHAPCHCRLPADVLCLACARWSRHYAKVSARKKAWKAGGNA